MIVFKAHPKAVYGVVFSPDGRFLLTSGGDETVRLWSLNSIEQLREWPGSEFLAPIAFSPDGKFIARGGEGVRAWPIDGPAKSVIRSRDETESIAFAPDGKVLVAHGTIDGLQRWEFPTGKRLPGGWGESDDQYPTGAVGYHPLGTILAACYCDGNDVICLWHGESGELLGSLQTDHFSDPRAIRFSPDGNLLAGICGPNLHIWDVETRKEKATRKVGTKYFKGLVFTPDGRKLATVSNDATVRLWDTTTWSEIGGFEWKIGKMSAIDVSADGCRMAAGGSTGKVVIWDVD